MSCWGAESRKCRRVRALLVAGLATGAMLVALLASAAGAAADTPFGGDPSQPVTPSLNCAGGAPPYFYGASSCTWLWTRLGVGSDIVPLPVAGGTGVITSVTLPAMPNPGPMQVVVLTAALAATTDPATPDYICCQVKQIGPTFTVPANQVTTVPENLAVSATEEANLSQPGDTSFGDEVAISVLSPTASLPLQYTGSNNDVDNAYFPAPSAPNSEFVQPTDPGGYAMLARFTLGATPGPPAPAPVPGPAPGPPAKGGLKLATKPLGVAADGKTLNLGKATNPPAAATTQTLTLPAAGASAAKPTKPVVLGAGKTTVPAGKTVPLKLKLNAKARAKLARGGVMKATLTVVATNAGGEASTVARTVKVKPAPRRHH